MKTAWTTAFLLLAVLAGGGAADKPQDKPAAKPAPKPAEKKKDEAQPDAAPACMQCGATCGLRPICICKAGTKKQPKVEFDVTCEPLCMPGCSSHIWPPGRRPPLVGCTGCREAACACPGKVRFRKTLTAEKIDEEKPTIDRTAAYVCRACTGAGRVGCSEADPPQQPARGWWGLPRSWPWPFGRH